MFSKNNKYFLITEDFDEKTGEICIIASLNQGLSIFLLKNKFLYNIIFLQNSRFGTLDDFIKIDVDRAFFKEIYSTHTSFVPYFKE